MRKEVYELTNRTRVKLSNALNESKYKLSPTTINILHLFLAQIYTEDVEFKRFVISFKDMEQKLGKRIDRRSLDSICKELLSNPIKVEEYEIPSELEKFADPYYYQKVVKKINYYNWASKASYCLEEKTFELEIHEDLKKHLLQLKKNFTTFSYKQITNLKSQYAKRLYMLLKQYMNTESPFWIINVEDLLYVLDVEDKYGKDFNDFRRKVLKIAQEQINKNSDIEFTFKEIKRGRKVIRLEFKMNYKEEREKELNDKSFRRQRAKMREKTRVKQQHKSGVLDAEAWLQKRKQQTEVVDIETELPALS